MRLALEGGKRRPAVPLWPATSPQVVFDTLGALRGASAPEADGIIDESRPNLLWITDFPLFGYDEEEGSVCR